MAVQWLSAPEGQQAAALNQGAQGQSNDHEQGQGHRHGNPPAQPVADNHFHTLLH